MHALVLGGGYAGVAVTRRLASRLPESVAVTLVDDTGDHLLKHEVHRVIRQPSVAEAITVDLPDLVGRATVREGTVTAVDPEARTVALADGDVLDYDACAVCLGAEPAFHGIDGVRTHGLPLTDVADARTIRAAFLEAAEGGGRILVAGAGLSGVQVAGELAALAEAEEVADAEIRLVERLPSVAPAFDERFQRAIRDALTEYGVAVETGRTVTSADASGVDLANGERMDCEALVWTGGIAGPAALGGDRPTVRATMELDDATFVLGDAARAVDADGEAVPASAQAAIREAPVVAENVARVVESADDDPGSFRPRLEPFAFDPSGWIVSVGDDAVAQVGSRILRGRAALALKTTVGAGYLSSVGAVRDAVGLVNEELGLSAATE
jgi:NADH dehydrogenase